MWIWGLSKINYGLFERTPDRCFVGPGGPVESVTRCIFAACDPDRISFVIRGTLDFCRPSGRALVAQRIEHLTTDQKVGGSNPFERTR